MTRPPRAAETEPEIGGIVLAAGEGKRFGGPKQVAVLDGRPLLEHAVRAMLAVPALDPVVVVLGAHADAVREQVDLGGVDVVVCDRWADGQSASLQAGVAALGEEMARLQRCAHRVVWLNPLAADPRYEPLTRGMQAALPHVDHLIPGNSIASLEALAELMEEGVPA